MYALTELKFDVICGEGKTHGITPLSLNGIKSMKGTFISGCVSGNLPFQCFDGTNLRQSQHTKGHSIISQGDENYKRYLYLYE